VGLHHYLSNNFFIHIKLILFENNEFIYFITVLLNLNKRFNFSLTVLNVSKTVYQRVDCKHQPQNKVIYVKTGKLGDFPFFPLMLMLCVG